MTFHRLSFALVAVVVSVAFAQLPGDLKSDLGEGVPAFKVRPGYRVTRAVPEKKLREGRFIQFSEDGKTLYLCARSGLYRMRLNIEGIRP